MSKNTREQVTDAVRNCVDCGSMVIGSSDVEESVDDIMFIIEALEQENKRLREELGSLDASLDERMAALGMTPLTDLLNGSPMPFSVHVGCKDMDFFVDWVARKREGYLKMRLRYEIGEKPKDDELFEWVFAHSAAFGAVHDHLRAALEEGKQ